MSKVKPDGYIFSDFPYQALTDEVDAYNRHQKTGEPYKEVCFVPPELVDWFEDKRSALKKAITIYEEQWKNEKATVLRLELALMSKIWPGKEVSK